MNKTKKDLFAFGIKLGFKDETEVTSTLRQAGINGSFDVQLWDTYTTALKRVAAERELDKRKAEWLAKHKELTQQVKLDPCSMCGSEVTPDHSLDRVFGADYGWRCSVGGKSHFVQSRWQHLKVFMTNKDPNRILSIS